MDHDLASLTAIDVLAVVDRPGCAPTGRARRSLLPALASGLVHAAVLCALACWAMPTIDPPEPLALEVREAEALPLGVVALPAETPAAVALAGADEATPVALLTAELGASDAQLLATGSAGDLATALTTALADLTAAGGSGLQGDAESANKPAGKPIRFFDAPLYPAQRSFVFVVDASGSMHGSRFDRARRELMATLEQLEPTQRFYVVFFNEYDFPQFHPQRTREYLPATPENLRRVQAWMDSLRAAGDTHPMSALRKGLELRPDALYLLSDGAFEVRTLSLIRQFNKHRTTIHTIGLEDTAGEALLKAIAEEHAGEYHFVK